MLCMEGIRRARGEGWREEEKRGWRGDVMKKESLTGGHPSNLLSIFPPPVETWCKPELNYLETNWIRKTVEYQQNKVYSLSM